MHSINWLHSTRSVRFIGGLWLLTLITIFSGTSAKAAVYPTFSQLSPGINNAKPDKIPALHYPDDLFFAGKEAWVMLSYVINTSGKATHILVEQFDGDPAFKQAAIDTVKRWSFKPATAFGNASVQAHNQVTIVYSQQRDKTSFVHKHYRSVFTLKNLIEAKDFHRSEKEVQALVKKRRHSLAEQILFRLTLAEYYETSGDKLKELAQLHILRTIEPSLMQRQWLVTIYERLITLLVNSHQFKDAQAAALTAQSLQLTELNDTINDALNWVQKAKAATAIVRRHVTTQGDTPWRQRLSFPSFQIIENPQHISQGELRCQAHYMTFNPDTEHHISLPDSWGDCWLYFFGPQDAKLTLAELPEGKKL